MVRRFKQERRELNKTVPLLMHQRIPLGAALTEQVQEIVRRKPDLTLREPKAKQQPAVLYET